MDAQVIDLQREAILDAAERLFEQYGYRKTTVEEIAQEARIGKGSVYLHFQSKEDLGLSWLARIHGRVFEDLEQIAAEHNSAVDRIRRVLEQRVMQRFDIAHRHRRSMDDSLAQLKEMSRERRETQHRKESELVSRLLKEAMADGLAWSSAPDEDAFAMILATNSLLPYSVRADQIGDRESVGALVRQLSDLLVRGIALPDQT
jgi:AcrR family transcriptional regulator